MADSNKIEFDYKVVSLKIDLIMPILKDEPNERMIGYLQDACIYSEELLPFIKESFDAAEREESDYTNVEVLGVRETTDADNARCFGIDVHGKNLRGNNTKEVEPDEATQDNS